MIPTKIIPTTVELSKHNNTESMPISHNLAIVTSTSTRTSDRARARTKRNARRATPCTKHYAPRGSKWRDMVYQVRAGAVHNQAGPKTSLSPPIEFRRVPFARLSMNSHLEESRADVGSEGPREQRLPGPGRAVKQHSLRPQRQG